jgi:hypothetical protein
MPLDGGTAIQDSVEFNCENESCVAFEGSQAYCTQDCLASSTCPNGFTCEYVVRSSGPPDSGIGPRKACVKVGLTQCIK